MNGSSESLPATLVQLTNGRPVPVRNESRHGCVVVKDVEIAETELLSGIGVWIPSGMLDQLTQHMGRKHA